MLDSLFHRFENIIILDVETSGFDPMRDEIIELAALKIHNRLGTPIFTSELDLFIRLAEGRRLPQEITQLTGITEMQLEREGELKPTACEKFTQILDCSTPLIVAYNAQFDLRFIHYFLNNYGKADVLNTAKYLDALTVYKDRRPYPHTLKDAVRAYSLKSQNTHHAIDDVKATWELLCAMENEFDDLVNYINLFGYNPKYGISGPKIDSVKYRPQPYNVSKKLYNQ